MPAVYNGARAISLPPLSCRTALTRRTPRRCSAITVAPMTPSLHTAPVLRVAPVACYACRCPTQQRPLPLPTPLYGASRGATRAQRVLPSATRGADFYNKSAFCGHSHRAHQHTRRLVAAALPSLPRRTCLPATCPPIAAHFLLLLFFRVWFLPRYFNILRIRGTALAPRIFLVKRGRAAPHWGPRFFASGRNLGDHTRVPCSGTGPGHCPGRNYQAKRAPERTHEQRTHGALQPITCNNASAAKTYRHSSVTRDVLLPPVSLACLLRCNAWLHLPCQHLHQRYTPLTTAARCDMACRQRSRCLLLRRNTTCRARYLRAVTGRSVQ